MSTAELVPNLTAGERARLADLETTIERDLGTFVEVGIALRTVRDEELYLDTTPPTFVAYLRQRWGMGESRGYQMIDAARVAEATSTNVEVAIPSEGVARLLVPFLDRESDEQPKLVEVWSKVAPKIDNGPVTAPAVKRALREAGYIGSEPTRATGGKPNQRVLLGEYGDRLAKAVERLEQFLNREFEPPAGRNTGELAVRYAAWCSVMAAVLQGLADGDVEADALRQRLQEIAGEILR